MIPDFQSMMLPLLSFCNDRMEHTAQEMAERLAQLFKVSEAERKELLPSGQQRVLENRVAWAKTYLKMANLVETVRRGYFKISKQGMDVLARKPASINIKYLEQFAGFTEARLKKKSKKSDHTEVAELPHDDGKTPEEALEEAYQDIRDALRQELLRQIKKCSPTFFEKLVVDLIVKMGYGGSIVDAGQAIGKSGDEGIDGIIKEDKLGLDIIYLQAKRWEATIGRPEIQKFVGALQGQRARKGLFITTSDFTADALSYASRIENKIVLISGDQLTSFMLDHNVGVSTARSLALQRVDNDYFAEE